ncbi:hypothetical protein HPB51_007861 [Rhipicephalus microplus]|uniref:CHHC U11-48K-type domain-containing protein n=1 Tax=Rhipicephalus microplus TaxID=6941 RepID=A0A9J6EML1_RHIMP|nr:hypothetical protein HPB51_007861 [Rhipicephalus microplus]
MATFKSLQDDLVVCPYNEHHRVKRGRLDIHISKCRKGGRPRRVLPCPFNLEHGAPAERDAFRHHLQTCPDKTRNLPCMEAREDHTYDLKEPGVPQVPVAGGGRPFPSEPEVRLVHSNRPGSSRAEDGEPSASQATQPLIDHPKEPVLAIESRAVTGEHHGAWDEARVGQPCGAEVTHSTESTSWLLAIKVTENIPFSEARKKVSLFSGRTYADAARRRAGRHLVTVGTQYSFADACTSRPPTKHSQAAPTFEVSQVHLHQTSETKQTIQTPQVNLRETTGTTQTTERAPVPLEKPPSASECTQGAMDVTPASSASPMLTESILVKRSPRERLREKQHPPVQAPDKRGEV